MSDNLCREAAYLNHRLHRTLSPRRASRPVRRVVMDQKSHIKGHIIILTYFLSLSIITL